MTDEKQASDKGKSGSGAQSPMARGIGMAKRMTAQSINREEYQQRKTGYSRKVTPYRAPGDSREVVPHLIGMVWCYGCVGDAFGPLPTSGS